MRNAEHTEHLDFSRVGVLLIHGLTGTPSEMRPIAKNLKKRGFSVETPLLAGHGKDHHTLLATSWQDWRDSVVNAYDAMMKEFDVVIPVGMSMGSILTVFLAHARPESVKAIVLLSTDFGIVGDNMPWQQCFLPLTWLIPWCRNNMYWTEEPPYGLKDVRMQRMITKSIEAAKNGETDSYGLFRTYSGSFLELHRMKKALLKVAPEVTCPALLVHSIEDTMLTAANASKMYHLLSSTQKSIVMINGCDHVMSVDLRKDEVSRLTGNFIQSEVEKIWLPKTNSDVA